MGTIKNTAAFQLLCFLIISDQNALRPYKFRILILKIQCTRCSIILICHTVFCMQWIYPNMIHQKKLLRLGTGGLKMTDEQTEKIEWLKRAKKAKGKEIFSICAFLSYFYMRASDESSALLCYMRR